MLSLHKRWGSAIKVTMHTQKWAKQNGFTIVELLIVVVVIAILAAITIVSYNGIQNRAKESAAQSAASQVAKKIALWQVDNPNTVPTRLLDVGINTSSESSTSFEYSPVSTRADGGWCATVSTTNKSYYITSLNSTPTTGGCPGHAQGGTVPITNLVLNPSLETSTDTYQSIGNPDARNIDRVNGVAAFSGNYVLRITSPSGGNIGGYGPVTETLPNGDYVASLWIRSSIALNVRMYLEGNAARTNGTSSGNLVLVPNTWTRLYSNITITTPGTIKVGFLSNTNPMPAGSTVDIDGAMMTTGTALPNYADGNSSNWTWNGTPHASTSKGVPL
jgi:prepilin-type N-terminal cleavage/methylation domain-containing protein